MDGYVATLDSKLIPAGPLAVPDAVLENYDVEQLMSSRFAGVHVSRETRALEVASVMREYVFARTNARAEARRVAEECGDAEAAAALGADDDDAHDGGNDTHPYYVVDLNTVLLQIHQWRSLLPRVHPFYALKCNPDPAILRTLAANGLGFDCASRTEIEVVLGLGVTTDRILYANPVKPGGHLRFARSVGVDVMTFDNEDELHKIKRAFPAARLILRIITDDSGSVCRLSSKFGAEERVALRLLATADRLGLAVIGVSFHAGSGCSSLETYTKALKCARRLFDEAERVYGKPMTVLDIGGGFPGVDDGAYQKVTFAELAAHINVQLDELFPAESGVRIVAEPGRYFVAASHTLAVCVFGKRQETPAGKAVESDDASDSSDASPSAGTRMVYYINDGVYQSFNCIHFDHAHPKPAILWRADERRTLADAAADAAESEVAADKLRPRYTSAVFGPTCDSMDLVLNGERLPELDVGDWLRFDAMGAYTLAAGSRFNGFFPMVRYVA